MLEQIPFVTSPLPTSPCRTRTVPTRARFTRHAMRAHCLEFDQFLLISFAEFTFSAVGAPVTGRLRQLSLHRAAPPPGIGRMTPQNLLRLHPFFAALPPADVNRLLLRTRCKRVPVGQVL